MSTPFLPAIYANTFSELDELVNRYRRKKLQYDDFQNIVEAYRRFGILGYFLSCSTTALVEGLQKSVLAFIHLMEETDHSSIVLSKSFALFDALAAKDINNAKKVAQLLSDVQYSSEYEYEDDYFYFKFVIQILLIGNDMSGLKKVLAQFESTLGEDETRFAVCCALVNRNPNEFTEALIALAEKHQKKIMHLKSLGVLKEEDWATHGQFFIEGLALQVLGETTGIKIIDQYIVGIPVSAHKIESSSQSPNIWLEPA